MRKGEAELLMKGSLHTDELLGAVVARETGLRTGRRISHVFIMDVPTYHKVLIVTDAAINIAPTLEDKVDICQNAIDLAISLGVDDAEGRDPRGGRDRHLEDAGDARRRGALQDGRPRADHGRPARRPAGVRQRDQQGGGARSRASSRRSPAIPTSCSRRISRPATSSPSSSVPGQRRQRRPGARRARADHPDQPRRQRALADRELRRRDARGARAAAALQP